MTKLQYKPKDDVLFKHVAATDEFKEIARLRARARHNEASALSNARNQGRIEGEQKGKAEGKAEGIAEGQIKSVIAFLEIRFGEIPAILRKNLLDVQDNERIDAALKLAATCQSLMEFQKGL